MSQPRWLKSHNKMVQKNKDNAWMRNFSTIRVTKKEHDVVTEEFFNIETIPADDILIQPEIVIVNPIVCDTEEVFAHDSLAEEIVTQLVEEYVFSPYVFESQPANNDDVGDHIGQNFVEDHIDDLGKLPIQLGQNTDPLVAISRLVNAEKFVFGPYMPYFDHCVIVAQSTQNIQDSTDLDVAIREATIKSWFGPVFGGLLDPIPISIIAPIYNYPKETTSLFKLIQQWCNVHLDARLECGVLPIPYNGTDGYCCFCNTIQPLSSLVQDHIMVCLLSFPERAGFNIRFIDNYYGGVIPHNGGLALRDIRDNQQVSFINPFYTWLYSSFVQGSHLSIEKLVYSFQNCKPVDYVPDILVDNGFVLFPCICCDNTGRQIYPTLEFLRLTGGERHACFKCGQEGMRISVIEFLALVYHPNNEPNDDGDTMFQKTLGLFGQGPRCLFSMAHHKRRHIRVARNSIKPKCDTFNCKSKFYAVQVSKHHHRLDQAGKWHIIELTITDHDGQYLDIIRFECVWNTTNFYS